eukprot:TRINITY_DN1875_c1_g1_i1.p1 TRINITY_DN1875_c1_g1~~TRINITY_DN1875_c1_g1_i1.p1  ORF type:complete len:2704 (+),score=764.56 TRINITY_DN1875_c1_g1_i1:161-8272(+)
MANRSASSTLSKSRAGKTGSNGKVAGATKSSGGGTTMAMKDLVAASCAVQKLEVPSFASPKATQEEVRRILGEAAKLEAEAKKKREQAENTRLEFEEVIQKIAALQEGKEPLEPEKPQKVIVRPSEGPMKRGVSGEAPRSRSPQKGRSGAGKMATASKHAATAKHALADMRPRPSMCALEVDRCLLEALKFEEEAKKKRQDAEVLLKQLQDVMKQIATVQDARAPADMEGRDIPEAHAPRYNKLRLAALHISRRWRGVLTRAHMGPRTNFELRGADRFRGQYCVYEKLLNLRHVYVCKAKEVFIGFDGQQWGIGDLEDLGMLVKQTGPFNSYVRSKNFDVPITRTIWEDYYVVFPATTLEEALGQESDDELEAARTADRAKNGEILKFVPKAVGAVSYAKGDVTLVIISSRMPAPLGLLECIRDGVVGVLYNWAISTPESLIADCEKALGEGIKASRIALVTHCRPGVLGLVRGFKTTTDSVHKMRRQRKFWKGLGMGVVSPGGRIEILNFGPQPEELAKPLLDALRGQARCSVLGVDELVPTDSHAHGHANFYQEASASYFELSKLAKWRQPLQKHDSDAIVAPTEHQALHFQVQFEEFGVASFDQVVQNEFSSLSREKLLCDVVAVTNIRGESGGVVLETSAVGFLDGHHLLGAVAALAEGEVFDPAVFGKSRLLGRPRLGMQLHMASPGLSRGVAEGSKQRQAIRDADARAANVLKQLPRGLRVCILGGTSFQEQDSETLTKAIANAVGTQLADEVVVITGGLDGVQKAFGQGLGDSFPSLVNLLPEGDSSHYGVGVDYHAGWDLAERMDVFGKLGDVYITIEGGPGVAKEARAAFRRGAMLIPMMSTGGASSGMFDFPIGAFERPSFATQEQWAKLVSRRAPAEVAGTVVEMLQAIMARQKEAAEKKGEEAAQQSREPEAKEERTNLRILVRGAVGLQSLKFKGERTWCECIVETASGQEVVARSRSSDAWKSLQPVWQHRCMLSWANPEKLRFVVYDGDASSEKPRALGHVTLDAEQFHPSGLKEELALSGKVSARLLVQIGLKTEDETVEYTEVKKRARNALLRGFRDGTLAMIAASAEAKAAAEAPAPEARAAPAEVTAAQPEMPDIWSLRPKSSIRAAAQPADIVQDKENVRANRSRASLKLPLENTDSSSNNDIEKAAASRVVDSPGPAADVITPKRSSLLQQQQQQHDHQRQRHNHAGQQSPKSNHGHTGRSYHRPPQDRHQANSAQRSESPQRGGGSPERGGGVLRQHGTTKPMPRKSVVSFQTRRHAKESAHAAAQAAIKEGRAATDVALAAASAAKAAGAHAEDISKTIAHATAEATKNTKEHGDADRFKRIGFAMKAARLAAKAAGSKGNSVVVAAGVAGGLAALHSRHSLAESVQVATSAAVQDAQAESPEIVAEVASAVAAQLALKSSATPQEAAEAAAEAAKTSGAPTRDAAKAAGMAASQVALHDNKPAHEALDIATQAVVAAGGSEREVVEVVAQVAADAGRHGHASSEGSTKEDHLLEVGKLATVAATRAKIGRAHILKACSNAIAFAALDAKVPPAETAQAAAHVAHMEGHSAKQVAAAASTAAKLVKMKTGLAGDVVSGTPTSPSAKKVCIELQEGDVARAASEAAAAAGGSPADVSHAAATAASEAALAKGRTLEEAAAAAFKAAADVGSSEADLVRAIGAGASHAVAHQQEAPAKSSREATMDRALRAASVAAAAARKLKRTSMDAAKAASHAAAAVGMETGLTHEEVGCLAAEAARQQDASQEVLAEVAAESAIDSALQAESDDEKAFERAAKEGVLAAQRLGQTRAKALQASILALVAAKRRLTRRRSENVVACAAKAATVVGATAGDVVEVLADLALHDREEESSGDSSEDVPQAVANAVMETHGSYCHAALAAARLAARLASRARLGNQEVAQCAVAAAQKAGACPRTVVRAASMGFVGLAEPTGQTADEDLATAAASAVVAAGGLRLDIIYAIADAVVARARSPGQRLAEDSFEHALQVGAQAARAANAAEGSIVDAVRAAGWAAAAAAVAEDLSLDHVAICAKEAAEAAGGSRSQSAEAAGYAAALFCQHAGKLQDEAADCAAQAAHQAGGSIWDVVMVASLAAVEAASARVAGGLLPEAAAQVAREAAQQLAPTLPELVARAASIAAAQTAIRCGVAPGEEAVAAVAAARSVIESPTAAARAIGRAAAEADRQAAGDHAEASPEAHVMAIVARALDAARRERCESVACSLAAAHAAAFAAFDAGATADQAAALTAKASKMGVSAVKGVSSDVFVVLHGADALVEAGREALGRKQGGGDLLKLAAAAAKALGASPMAVDEVVAAVKPLEDRRRPPRIVASNLAASANRPPPGRLLEGRVESGCSKNSASMGLAALLRQAEALEPEPKSKRPPVVTRALTSPTAPPTAAAAAVAAEPVTDTVQRDRGRWQRGACLVSAATPTPSTRSPGGYTASASTGGYSVSPTSRGYAAAPPCESEPLAASASSSSTTLVADVPAGCRLLHLTSEKESTALKGIEVGSIIFINPQAWTEEDCVVEQVGDLWVRLNTPLRYMHKAGEAVIPKEAVSPTRAKTESYPGAFDWSPTLQADASYPPEVEDLLKRLDDQKKQSSTFRQSLRCKSSPGPWAQQSRLGGDGEGYPLSPGELEEQISPHRSMDHADRLPGRISSMTTANACRTSTPRSSHSSSATTAWRH